MYNIIIIHKSSSHKFENYFSLQVVGSHSNTLVFHIRNPKNMVGRKYNFSGGVGAECGNTWCDIPVKVPTSPALHQNIVLLVCIEGGEHERANFEYQTQETFRYV